MGGLLQLASINSKGLLPSSCNIRFGTTLAKWYLIAKVYRASAAITLHLTSYQNMPATVCTIRILEAVDKSPAFYCTKIGRLGSLYAPALKYLVKEDGVYVWAYCGSSMATSSIASVKLILTAQDPDDNAIEVTNDIVEQ